MQTPPGKEFLSVLFTLAFPVPRTVLTDSKCLKIVCGLKKIIN